MWDEIKTKNPGKTEDWVKKEFTIQAQKHLNVRRVRLLLSLSESSVVFVNDKDGHPCKAYKTDGNAYMDVWLLSSGKTQGETVSRFDAHQSNLQSKIKEEHPTAKKLMRLHVNDMVTIGEGRGRQILRVKELSGQRIILVEHQQAGKAKEMPLVSKRATRVLKEGLRKVSVDITGRVQDGGPFGPDGRGKSSKS